jgi:signal transduction histidine kinase
MDLDELGTPLWAIVLAHGAVAGLLVALFGLVLFRRSVIEPVEAMRVSTASIAAGDFGAQVSDNAPREFADLARSLNVMSTALRAYQSRTAEQLEGLATANRELKDTRDALIRAERLAVTGRLAAGFAHEIGNPLTAVQGFVEILLAGAQPGTPEASVLERTSHEVDRIHDLLGNILDYARVDRMAIAAVDARRLLHQAVATVRHLPDFRGVTFEEHAPAGLGFQGDEARLHQALVNLLLNAVAAGAHAITLSVVQAGDRVEIRVEDDGEGVSAEHLPRLFEPFFTTRAPGVGTGLGLWIVHRIVEQHGGVVSVVSEPGRGASFRLTLAPGRPPQG